jgi:hypothetical protein
MSEAGSHRLDDRKGTVACTGTCEEHTLRVLVLVGNGRPGLEIVERDDLRICYGLGYSE